MNPWLQLVVGQRSILDWSHLLQTLFWNSYRWKHAALMLVHVSLALPCCFPEIVKQRIPVLRVKQILRMVIGSLKLPIGLMSLVLD